MTVTALIPLTIAGLPAFLDTLTPKQRQFVSACGFRAVPCTFCFLPNAEGDVEAVLAGITNPADLYALAHAPMMLPPGSYRLDARGERLDPKLHALGWHIGSYQFTRYRKARREPARLEGLDDAEVQAIAQAVATTRDLVNTAPEDCGPAELEAHARAMAERFGAKVRVIVGDELLTENFPAIHAVGRASPRAPRLIELVWGDENHPKLALLGKGVCFDTGGLDIKAADGMRWMKKDMGGAAHALALAELIMARNLPWHMRLLVSAVDNAISGNAYRPGDVIRTRSGQTVEIDNTDAEGRVVLCDAMTYAAEHKPDLMVDFATLTGAARVALGPDLPPVFSNRDQLRDALVKISHTVQDPLWPMPLWAPYQDMLASSFADFANAGASRHAGCITAALYLKRFVPDTLPWLHLDTYAWNDADRPGRPRGGEALGLRAVYQLLIGRAY
ncbi:MAG: leucyl aminopeptidase family protein [Ahniella sp.]|nr:leucyl aminopeptidase family protein [Ahniella sp.]